MMNFQGNGFPFAFFEGYSFLMGLVQFIVFILVIYFLIKGAQFMKEKSERDRQLVEVLWKIKDSLEQKEK